MRYGNIPEEVLNVELGECYTNGAYYLRTELDDVNESIVHAEWKLDEKDLVFPKLTYFRAWTNNYVMQLIDTALMDQQLLIIPKNPKTV